MKKQSTYDLYMDNVIRASNSGFSPYAIINELSKEKENIRRRCLQKVASMALDKSPYPRREVNRAARECLATIDRIINEIETKEISV